MAKDRHSHISYINISNICKNHYKTHRTGIKMMYTYPLDTYNSIFLKIINEKKIYYIHDFHNLTKGYLFYLYFINLTTISLPATETHSKN